MKTPFALIEVFNDPALHFRGNTAAVLSGNEPWGDQQMREIAADWNQPATTFLWPAEEDHSYHVRWFAPDAEIGLCGHGTLAALAFLAPEQEITLRYRHGTIRGRKAGAHQYSMTLDTIPVTGTLPVPAVLEEGLGIPIQAHYSTGNKHIILVNNETELKGMKPDFARLREYEVFGYAVTAPGDSVDFVSRTIVPHVRQLEDPATGSSHAALFPFWGQRLGKNSMTAYQLSERGGKFSGELAGDIVKLTGSYTVLARGEWMAER